MPTKPKPQRIRDPLHNLIEFNSGQFEATLWKVIQTRPFQRLRRIRQLGFSELVFPGATHTRFAHSIGAYHIARQLMQIIKHHIQSNGGQLQDTQERVALAAALVHDVGHGMFSHAFEDVGKKLKLKMAEHEHVSNLLIRNDEISNVFKELGSGFANDVADVIGRGRPGNLYDAVVSSQFDADRLDYMQRDRLMTGVQNSGIDFTWLINNLEVGEITTGTDDQKSGSIETFMIGNKAIHAAETYILALFHLYPTVYFHKTTRGAEKIFSEIMLRLIKLVQNDSIEKTALPNNHPMIRFAKDPNEINNVLALDDTVFWGALPMLIQAEDPLINKFSNWLWMRKLPKCIDIKRKIVDKIGANRGASPDEIKEREKKIERVVWSARDFIEEKNKDSIESISSDIPKLLLDYAERSPYKKLDESKGHLSQISINVRHGDERKILDMAEASQVVAGLDKFSLLRVYYDAEDKESVQEMEKLKDYIETQAEE
jgi:HD superfamily phosphohydrolase